MINEDLEVLARDLDDMDDQSSVELDVPSKDSATEITVTIKDEERSLKSKFLIYEKYYVSEDDPIIKDCIARTLRDFNGEPSDIRLKINLVVL